MAFNGFFSHIRKSTLSLLVLLVIVLLAMQVSNILVRKVDISITSLFRPASASRLLMSMDGFLYEQLTRDAVPWQMQARHADLYENREALLQTVEIVLDTENKQRVTLTGDEGTLNTANGNASIKRLEHDVRLVTSDGYLLTTPSLRWVSAEHVIKTNDPFKLLGSNIYLEGKGLTASTGLHAMTVNEHVKAILQE